MVKMTKNPFVCIPNIAIPDCPYGLDMKKSHVEGNLYCRYSKITGEASLESAVVEGHIDFQRIQNNTRLHFNKITVNF